MNTLPLPVELFPNFMQHLSQDELMKTCLASRIFYDEATDLLYRNANLQSSTAEQLLSWSVRISSSEDLAHKARALCLPNLLSFDSMSQADYGKCIQTATASVSQAVHSLVNLKSLSILPCKSRHIGARRYLTPQVLLGCTFRLHTFRSAGLSDSWNLDQLFSFLRQQDEIRDWRSDKAVQIHAQERIALDVLPRLRIAHVQYMPDDSVYLQMATRRRLKRLRVDISGNSETMDLAHMIGVIASCGDTLTHFHLKLNLPSAGTQEYDHVQILSKFAQALPKIEFLYYSEPATSAGKLLTSTAFAQALSAFARLAQFGIRHDSAISATLLGQAFGECCCDLQEPAKNDTVFPVELFEQFLGYLSQDQLVKICTVSRIFHQEATGLLYRNVDLQGSSAYQLLSWSVRVGGNEGLAQKVRTLCLPNSLSFDNIFRGDYKKWLANLTTSLSRAMNSVTHLKSLCILPCRQRHGGTSRYLTSSILLGCTFRLHTFRSEGLSDWHRGELVSFLNQQDGIRDWQSDYSILAQGEDGAPGVALDVLPRLSIAHVFVHHETVYLQTVALRQLTRLRLDILGQSGADEWEHLIAILAPCGQTLTRFHLEFNWIAPTLESEHVQLLLNIARCLPMIQFLYYAEPVDTVGKNLESLAFTKALSAFKHLTHLGVNHDGTNHDGMHLVRELGHTFSQRCMAACPSLQHVSVLVLTFAGPGPCFTSVKALDSNLGPDSTYLTGNTWRDT
ncbi:hypothetical protein HWV62_11814 [Athelia sp. TMB]|nr:hypothetical protein HWV62_11814 [Athelia sp. TMB]